MSTFNPDAPCRVLDKERTIPYWRSEWAANYRRHASEFDDGIINWDGLLLDGWCAA